MRETCFIYRSNAFSAIFSIRANEIFTFVLIVSWGWGRGVSPLFQKIRIFQVGIDTNLGGWVPLFQKIRIFHVGINTNLGGWVPLFLENWNFQVGIDTKFGGGGVFYFQISKSQVFGPWVGILDPDFPLSVQVFMIYTTF